MSKNIWIAASDGDLERVKYLVETEGVDPNIADENTYTPLHAAASWGHEPVLRFLVAMGGSIDITDEEGDSPLFAVESVQMAHVCIDLGADPTHCNVEGLTAAAHHAQDSPDISAYLSSITGESVIAHPNASSDAGDEERDERMELDDDLLNSANAIMAEAQRTGADPDDALREVVSSAVDRRVLNGGARVSLPNNSHPDFKRRRDDVGR